MSDMNDFIIKDGVLTKYNGKESDVVVPDGVTTIGEMAFSNCRSLESIVIPKSVTSIEVIAFCHCRGLTSITIPDSVTHIGGDAFSDTPWIEKQRTINPFVIINGILIDGRMHKGDVVVPDGVTSIGSNAFYKCSDLTSITIPDSVTSIGDASFCGCSCLASITIPNSVTSIGSNAFEYCLGLTSITIPNGVTSIGKSTFWACRNLASITIPDSVTSIGRVAFENCSTLTSITIPQNVLRIGDNAFKECESLTEIRILSNALETGSIEGTFDSCKNLKRVYAPLSAMTKWNSYCKSSFVFIEQDGDNRNIFVYSEKSDSNNISSLICKDKYGLYDSELINNGHLYKYTLPQRLAGAVGRLKNPVKLTDENRALYIDMLNKNAKKLIPFAEEYGMPELIRYLLELNVLSEKALETVKKEIESSTVPDIAALAGMEVTAATPVSIKVEKRPAVMSDAKKTAKKPKPQKLSELKKVELLEETVMQGSVQDVIDVYKMYKPFELTARALGLACRYRGIEYVEALVKCGARFKYKYDSALNRKYHMYDITCCGHYRTEYYLMLIPSQCPVAESLYGTNGFDYLGLEELYEDNLLPIESRLEVLDYLAENKTKLGINMDQMLFYALMKEELAFADKLIEMGVNLDSEYPLYYSDYSSLTYLGTITMPDNSIYSQAYLQGSKSIPVLDRLCALTEPSGRRPAVNHGCFENDFLDDDEKLAYAISHLDLSRVNKKKIMEKAVKNNSVGTLKILCESGWLNNAKTREELISYADSNKCKESLAYLLDFKNKTVDVAAEEEKKQAKIMKELNEDPNSVSVLKRIWSYKKLSSGNLMITSYKGEAIHVEVPSVIGKSKVVMIGYEAFSDNKNGIVNADVRRRIESIVIPDGVAFIEERAFEGCRSLKSITIPDSLISIGRYAFSNCSSLTSITIPDSVTSIGISHFRSNAVSIHTKKGSAADKIFRGEPQIKLIYDD